MNKSDACAAVGISRKTLYSWLEKGEAKESERHTDFFNAYQLAVQSSYQVLLRHVLEGDSQVRTELDGDGNVIKIVKTETRSWRQAAWLLEKRFPHLFGETVGNPPASGGAQQPPNYTALVTLIEQFERRNET
ncbi:hypothetical protein F4X33_17460 [Candidatus Poribacteria bacterium]|nr:hypothetical protein [Candidatus Poribacteria bacterium]